jgi:hypothetical protein
MEKMVQWLSETHGQIRGAPIPNWFFIVAVILIIFNYFLYPCIRRKKMIKKKKKIENVMAPANCMNEKEENGDIRHGH